MDTFHAANTLTVLAEHSGDHDWGPGPWFLLIPLTFWLLVLAAFLLIRRRWARRWGQRGGESTLADLFARGEISEEEYRGRLKVLRETRR